MIIIVLLIIIIVIIYIVYRNNVLKEYFNDIDVQPGSCLGDLLAGNEIYAKDPKYIKEREAQLKGQTPCIVVVSCSDSRSSVPIITDQLNLGRIFEIKTAGNSLAADDIESIKVALEGIQPVPELVLVLGHSNCSAVSTSVKSLYDPSLREEYPTIVNDIIPSIFRVLEKQKLFQVTRAVNNGDETNGTNIDSDKFKKEIQYIKDNEDYFVQQSIVQNAIDKAQRIAYTFDLEYGKMVVPAVYNIDTGLIDLV